MDNSAEKINDIHSYTMEGYAVFQNVDKSIIGLNGFIEQFGYKFICFNYSELEKNFANLFSLPKNFKPQATYTLGKTGLVVTEEFFQAITNSPSFDRAHTLNFEVVFLKRINDFEQKIINKQVDISSMQKILGEQQRFVNNLVQQFRLFKNGDVDCPIIFQIAKDSREMGTKVNAVPIKSYTMNNFFSLTENEILEFSIFYKEKFEINSLTAMAIDNFNLSYKITDIKTKYITLMTCLECLFNQGKDQITHTVSRHLALIISNSIEEFKDNYTRIKKLYQLRSTIVHGDKSSEDLVKATEELQNMVRKAINYCQNLNINKRELFDHLNALGYGK